MTSSRDSNRLKAFHIRQQDTGWGYAIASAWIPLVGIYYAITRRTITPFVYYIGGSFAAGLLIAFGAVMSGADSKGINQANEAGSIVLFCISPYFVKKGINKARVSAKKELESLDRTSS